jgi:hypothetical protein
MGWLASSGSTPGALVTSSGRSLRCVMRNSLATRARSDQAVLGNRTPVTHDPRLRSFHDRISTGTVIGPRAGMPDSWLTPTASRPAAGRMAGSRSDSRSRSSWVAARRSESEARLALASQRPCLRIPRHGQSSPSVGRPPDSSK